MSKFLTVIAILMVISGISSVTLSIMEFVYVSPSNRDFLLPELTFLLALFLLAIFLYFINKFQY
ncbi:MULTISPECIES: hypothetical protein [Staphylococcus]|uniref:hypothetical protein n=1 Tax=Staphylococcus TaxID=1279 RepID=UPI001368BA3F|nr:MULTISPECIES: hypothetical protein [Staphylococcus]MEB6747785.1 hypothetical protein [Staphylococcus haemolyticus]NAM96228.1 hypothetical protein [Staphylococcus hominis]